MKRIDIAKRAVRSLRQAKIRTLLTALAIAVGAFTLTLSMAAGEGSRQYADKLITSNIDPQALIISQRSDVGLSQPGLKEYDPDTTQYGGGTLKTLDNNDLKKIKATKNVEKVVPSYVVAAQYVTFEGSDKKYTSDVSMYDTGRRTDTIAGTAPALGAQLGDNEVMLPESYVKVLGNKKAQQLVGKKVTLHLVKARQTPTQDQISAILATEGSDGLTKLSQAETREASYVVRGIGKQSATSFSTNSSLSIAENQARELSDFLNQGTDKFQKYISVSAQAKKGVDPESVKASLKKYGFSVSTAKDIQGLIFTIVNILQNIVIGFGALALIASVFGIINTQYISVLERTQQIGLMKALGMRRKDVSKLFRYEAAWIGFLGGIIGSGGAWLLGTSLNPFISKQLDLGADTQLLIFQPIPILILIFILMLIAIIAGYLPARKAAKLDPIEALRTE